MRAMTLSGIRRALADQGLRLTKSLGQSFLHDGNQLRRIVKAAQLSQADRVLEIGPGLGPLTELLLASAGAVLAIEKDRRLADFLRQRFAAHPNLTILHADALRHLKEAACDWTDWKLVANLPYSVGSAVLVQMAQAATSPKLAVVTLQLEVAQRLMARPGTKDYGVLTLLVQLRYEPGHWFSIPASCFFPAPKVRSACVSLARRPERLLERELELTFRQIVKQSFAQRRKMMLKLLRTHWREEDLKRSFAALGLSPEARGETTCLRDFVALANLLHARVGVDQ
jgi:16S rRNA (adenine1518-N6/adenine1519-N6)-dimethyltransferase